MEARQCKASMKQRLRQACVGGRQQPVPLYVLLTRKEVSVGWKDTSIPHLLGYGSLLYVVEQLLMYPSDLLKTRLQADMRPVVNLAEVRGRRRASQVDRQPQMR